MSPRRWGLGGIIVFVSDNHHIQPNLSFFALGTWLLLAVSRMSHCNIEDLSY